MKKQVLVILGVIGPFIIAVLAYNQISSRNDEAINLSLPRTNAALLEEVGDELAAFASSLEELHARVEALEIKAAEYEAGTLDLAEALAGQTDLMSALEEESRANLAAVSEDVIQLQTFVTGILSAAAGAGSGQEDEND